MFGGVGFADITFFISVFSLIVIISYLVVFFKLANRVDKMKVHIQYMHRLMKLDAIKKGLIDDEGEYIGYSFDENNMDKIKKK